MSSLFPSTVDTDDATELSCTVVYHTQGDVHVVVSVVNSSEADCAVAFEVHNTDVSSVPSDVGHDVSSVPGVDVLS